MTHTCKMSCEEYTSVNYSLVLLWFSWVTLLHMGTQVPHLFAKERQPLSSVCPHLPSAQEIFERQSLIDQHCIQHTSSNHLGQSRQPLPSDVDWMIQVLTLELSVLGGVGWRVYQPLTSRPARIPQADPPGNACAYRFSLFEQEDQVWALERWSFRAPSAATSIRCLLSHSHYTTIQLRLTASSALSDSLKWDLLPQGICPSLIPHTLDLHSSTIPKVALTPHSPTQTPPLQTPVHLTPLLGCGSGSTMRGHSLLKWTRLPLR